MNSLVLCHVFQLTGRLGHERPKKTNTGHLKGFCTTKHRPLQLEYLLLKNMYSNCLFLLESLGKHTIARAKD